MLEYKVEINVKIHFSDWINLNSNSHRSRRADIGKHGSRRPFTIVEVEVLVQVVEKLGTGRWREIKLHAFDYANHRTYVDLKYK